MNPYLIVRNAIAVNLEKRGYTLQDFETALKTINTGEGVLQTVKIASGLTDNPISGAIGSATSFVGGSFLPLTMGAGSLLGLGVDAAEDGVRSQNARLSELRRNIEIMKKMKTNTAIEHGLKEK